MLWLVWTCLWLKRVALVSWLSHDWSAVCFIFSKPMESSLYCLINVTPFSTIKISSHLISMWNLLMDPYHQHLLLILFCCLRMYLVSISFCSSLILQRISCSCPEVIRILCQPCRHRLSWAFSWGVTFMRLIFVFSFVSSLVLFFIESCGRFIAVTFIALDCCVIMMIGEKCEKLDWLEGRLSWSLDDKIFECSSYLN